MKRAKQKRFRVPEPKFFFLHTMITREELATMYPPIDDSGRGYLINGELLRLDGARIIGSERRYE